MNRGPTAKQTATCFSARTWSLYILVLSYMTVMLDGVNRLGAVRRHRTSSFLAFYNRFVMSSLWRTVHRIGLMSLMLAPFTMAADWTTFGHDPQRSGWAFEETTLSPANVSGLELKWKSKLKNEFYKLSALTAPIVASNVSTAHGVRSVVYVAGITGTVFALDAQTGEELWTHTFRSVVLPGKGGYQGTFLCPNGITATPVVDSSTGILYLIAPNGALYGLDLGGGKVRYGPVQFVAPFSKNWSLNLAYTGLRRRNLGILFSGRTGSAPPVDPANAAIEHGYRGHLGAGRTHYRKKWAGLWFHR